ncbi:MAG TPA: DUF2239 family protein [Roseomonas sp.]|jgi:hypothetical protein
MSDPLPDPRPCTAFDGPRRIARGPLAAVALAVRAALAADPPGPLLVFDDVTGAVIDLDLRGTPAEVAARHAGLAEPAAPRGRGRPRLGVVAREVTLLPRHWDWLALQRGGASHALRRLVEEAMRADAGQSRARAARDAAYRFLSAMAGDLPGFEEAARALFADDRARFAAEAAGWPPDIRAHALALAWAGDPAAPS